MKNFFVLIICLFPLFVIAKTCSTDVYNSEKEIANKIEVSYKKVEPYDQGGGFILYDLYNVNFNNVYERFYFTINDYDYKNYLKSADDNYTFNAEGGKYTYNIYSDQCEEPLKTVYYYYPKFNYYSLDDFCKGNKSILKICDSWIKEGDFEYFDNINREDFISLVEKYNNGNIFEKVKYFVADYLLYAIIIICGLIIVFIYICIKVVNIVFGLRRKNENKKNN